MTESKITMTEVERATLDGMMRHRSAYLESGGVQGHILSFAHLGGHRFTTTLLLETSGRKSGERRMTPLIYGDAGGEVLIVASKGGADVHPAWYWNLQTMKDAIIQIGTQAFRANWREPSGQEREKLWAFMAELFPPYRDYQQATSREIPIIAFAPGEAVEVLKA